MIRAQASSHDSDDLVLTPAVRQLELLRAGEISVAELAEAHIRQIERLNPQLNAFVDFDAERVRAQARQLDAPRETARAVARAAGHGEVFDCDGGLSSARSAACCTRATFRTKTRWWWRDCARRER